MTLYRFSACVEGWNRTHGGDGKGEPPSDAEFDAMKRAHDELDRRRRGA